MFSFIITDDKKKVEFHQDCLLSFCSSHWKNVATAWNLGHLNIICTEGYAKGHICVITVDWSQTEERQYLTWEIIWDEKTKEGSPA